MALLSDSSGTKDPDVKRFREGRPKSKNGCKTCKIRRVKCDETKPCCTRCSSTGRKCDGYTPAAPKRVASKPRKIIQRKAKSLLSLYSPSVDISGSQLERRSFHYFRSRKMTELPGNFEPYFWDHLVLQFSHSDLTIRHSLIALSAIYESHEQESLSLGGGGSLAAAQSRSLYVLEQYNKAIQHLATSITCAHQDPRATMISCLIFVWIEFLQKNIDSGLQHLKSGLKIMQDITSARNTSSETTSILLQDRNSDDIYGSLNRSFTRLSIQAAIHGSPTSDFTSSSTMPLFSKAPIPSSFVDIFESRDWLDNEMNSIFGHLRRLRDVNQLAPTNNHPIDLLTLNGIRNSYLARIQQWGTAASTMATAKSPTTTAQISGVLYLQLYYTLVVLILKTLFVETEMAFDEHTSEFERILSLAERIMHNPHTSTTTTAATNPTTTPTTARPVLSFDMGIIPPLLFLALKCRVLPLRQKAIALIKQSPQQEGIWHRDSVIKAAELKVMLEEEGRRGGQLSSSSFSGGLGMEEEALGEPLPCSARIFAERVRYSYVCGRRIAVLCYKKGRHNQDVELTAELGEIEGLGDML